ILHSEDVFSYGSAGTKPNEKKMLQLVSEVKKLGPKTIDFSHLSLASVYSNQDLLREISKIVGIGRDQNHMSAWIGIETGSCRMLKMHMPQKALPGEIENWQEIVRDCYLLFDQESWLPVASL